jgi:hypothetical protein
MRYKAMAKKLRQLVELDDPIPTEAVLISEESKSFEKSGGKSQFIEKPHSCCNSQSVENKDSALSNNKNEITVRNKSKWWRRLVGGVKGRWERLS